MNNNTVRISVTGDIICKKEMCDRAKTESGFDFSDSLKEISHLFSDSDLVIGNLETPVSRNSAKLVTERRSFCAPPEFARAVFDAGIRTVSTANNHALDRGIEGLNETISILDEIGFVHSGTYSSSERINTIVPCKGLNIGIMSYTYGTNAHHNGIYLDEEEEWRINLFQKQEFHNKMLRYIFSRSKDSFFFRQLDKLWCFLHPQYLGKAIGERRQPDSYELKKMHDDIKDLLSAGPDISIMCMHIGGQYNEEPTVYAKETAARLKKHGINLVIGNHEHRIQKCDLSSVKDNHFTTYCLGNLLSTAGVTEKPMTKETDYSVICHIDIDSISKTISRISCNIIKIILNKDGIIQALPAYDLYDKTEGEEKEKLEKGILTAIRRFSGGTEQREIREEYCLYER